MWHGSVRLAWLADNFVMSYMTDMASMMEPTQFRVSAGCVCWQFRDVWYLTALTWGTGAALRVSFTVAVIFDDFLKIIWYCKVKV